MLSNKKHRRYMKIISYEFSDGTCSDVEVSDEIYEQIEKLDKEEKRNHWKETRRHESLEQLMQNGWDFCSNETPLSHLMKIEENIVFEKMLGGLTSAQRELLEMVLIDGVKMAEIAKAAQVSSSTIRNKFFRIVSKIRRNVCTLHEED